MEKNLILLGMKLKKDPITYKSEYLTQLQALNTLSNLPNPPMKQIKPMIFFILKHCKIDPINSINSIVNLLEVVKDYKSKKLILNGLLIVRQKKLIESKVLLKLIIYHGNDLRYFLKGTQEFLDVDCYQVLSEWYKRGTERQRVFCYFLLLVLFSKIHDVSDKRKMERDLASVKDNMRRHIDSKTNLSNNISDSLEGSNDDEGIIADSNTDDLEEYSEDDNTTLYSNDDDYLEGYDASNISNNKYGVNNAISDSNVDDNLEGYDANNISNNKYGIDNAISDSNVDDNLEGSDARNITDLSSEDEESDQLKLKINEEARFNNSDNQVDLLELENILIGAFFDVNRIAKTCCLYFLNRTEVKFDISKLTRGKEHAKALYDELINEVMDRDIKIMKIKIFILFRSYFKMGSSAIGIILKMIDLEKEDLKDLLECIVKDVGKKEAFNVVDVISEKFLGSPNESVVAYGLNVMREIYSALQKIAEEGYMVYLKEKILKSAEIFKGCRTKSIYYAYKQIIKVLVNGEVVENPVEHIRRKTTKEEKTIMRNKGREEAKRSRNESKREEKHELYKKRVKGRKRTVMLKFMLKKNKKSTGKRNIKPKRRLRRK